ERGVALERGAGLIRQELQVERLRPKVSPPDEPGQQHASHNAKSYLHKHLHASIGDSCTRRTESVREDPGRQCPDGTDRGHAPRSESAEHTSRGAAAPVTRAALPSTTTSSPWKTWHPMMQREFLARFFTLRSSRPVVTCSASSSQTATIVVTCGRASG